ncbi:MAG: D-sedoheptulose-7-phosphate isomerase [bacterium]
MKTYLKAYIDELKPLLAWLESEQEKLEVCAQKVVQSLKEGGKILLFGCGGSSADAQHISAELIGRFKKERSPLPALALTTNTSILTALSNDYSFDIVFARQVEALAAGRDIVIGISTSGKSKSVIEGIKMAKRKGAFTIALSGGDGGELAREADIAFIVPSTNTPLIQSIHLMIGHLLCEIIDEQLSAKDEKEKA